MKKITVIGCGISGLSSAVLLAREGFEVKIVAKDFPPNTTSDKAAAFWSPYYANGERVARWANESYFEHEKLARISGAGVSMTKLHRFRKKDFAEAEDWESAVPEGKYRVMDSEEIPADYDEGFEVDVPLIETQIFLPYLMSEVRKAGGKILQRKLSSPDEIKNETDFI